MRGKNKTLYLRYVIDLPIKANPPPVLNDVVNDVDVVKPLIRRFDNLAADSVPDVTMRHQRFNKL